MNEDRYERGWRTLAQLDALGGQRVVDRLNAVAPDLARYTVEFAFGDVVSRPGLELKSREIATVAALTALGNAPAQLKFHMAAALNVGCSRAELVEIIIQMAVYAGFPAALNAAYLAQELFAEQDAVAE